MATVLPDTIKYADEMKPVSVPANKFGTFSFLPTTSGPYTSTNNTIRIPIQSSGFVDMANATLRFSAAIAAGGCSAYVDGSAIAFFRRLTIYSASGQQLSSIDQLNRLQNALEDIEYNRSTCNSYRSILEGTAVQRHRVRIDIGAVAAAEYPITFYLNDQLVDTLTTATAKSVKIGEFTFASTAVALTLVITHLPTGQTRTVVLGTASVDGAVGPVSVGGSATAGSFQIAGVDVQTGNSASFEYIPQVMPQCTIINTSGALAPVAPANPTGCYSQTTRWFELPVMNLLSSLNVYVPAFLSPAGYYLEFLLDSDRNALVPSNSLTTSTATYTLDNVMLHAPVISYDNAVMSSMVDMVNKVGMIKMSGVDWQSQVVSLASTSTQATIPLGFKFKSLKSILFFVQAQSPATTPSNFVFAQSAREGLQITQYFLSSGTAVYPAQPILGGGADRRNRNGEIVMELLKSVSKLSDIRLGTKIDKDNFGLIQSQGGVACYGIDLESSSAQEFIKSGLNNNSSAETLYLNLTLAGGPTVDSTIYIYACYDSDVAVLANRDVIVDR